MTGDDLEIGVDEDRRIKAELFDRTSDLPDLPFAVLSRVARIEFQSINRLVNNSRQTVARLIAVTRDQVRTHVLRNSSAVGCPGRVLRGRAVRAYTAGLTYRAL